MLEACWLRTPASHVQLRKPPPRLAAAIASFRTVDDLGTVTDQLPTDTDPFVEDVLALFEAPPPDSLRHSGRPLPTRRHQLDFN